jgi:hypothetical protein
MAKIVEDVIIIKFSKLVKDNNDIQSLAGQDIQQALEQVAQELVGDSVIVEVVKE